MLLFLVQLIQVGVLARYLSPKDFGNMALLLIVINVLHAFSDLGMGNSLIAHDRYSKTEMTHVYWLGIFSGFVLSCLVYLSAGLLARILGNGTLAYAIKWISPYFILISLSQPFMAILQKQLEFKRIALCEIMGALSGLAFAIWAAISGLGLMALTGGYMMIIAVRSILLITLRPVNIGMPAIGGFKGISQHLHFGAFQLVERVVNVFKGQVDKALLAKFLGVLELGYYSVAMQLALRPVMLLSPVLMKVGFPVLSQVSSNKKQIRKAYLDIMQFVSFLGAPLYIGLFVLGNPLMELWLGRGWESSQELFRILVFIGLAVALGNPAGSLLLALKKPGLSLGINIFGFITNLLAILIGVKWGAEGIAYALLFNNCIVLFSLDYWLGAKFLDISPGHFTKIWLPNLIRASAMGIGVWAASLLVVSWYLSLQLVLLILLGVMLYLFINIISQKQYLEELKRRLFGEAGFVKGSSK